MNQARAEAATLHGRPRLSVLAQDNTYHKPEFKVVYVFLETQLPLTNQLCTIRNSMCITDSIFLREYDMFIRQ